MYLLDMVGEISIGSIDSIAAYQLWEGEGFGRGGGYE